jgi:hypothetical protein
LITPDSPHPTLMPSWHVHANRLLTGQLRFGQSSVIEPGVCDGEQVLENVKKMQKQIGKIRQRLSLPGRGRS